MGAHGPLAYMYFLRYWRLSVVLCQSQQVYRDNYKCNYSLLKLATSTCNLQAIDRHVLQWTICV